VTEANDEEVGILLVDDRQANLLALKGVLERPDYEFVLAESGEEALWHVLRRDFAVILLDVAMPGLDGFETATLIRQRKRSSVTPILFVTATGHDEENVAKGYGAGAVDYLRKPLDAFAVQSKVASFAQLFRQRRQLERQTALLRAAELSARELEFTRQRLASEARYRDRLAAQYEVVSRLGGASSLAQIAPGLLQTLCTRLGWLRGALWQDAGQGKLRPLATWPPSQEPGVPSLRIQGEGPWGEAWRSRAQVIAPSPPDAEAGDAGHTLFHPVLCGEEVSALLELHASAVPEDASVRTIATICGQLGLFAQRTRTAESLRTSEERLSTTLRSIGDAVISTDADGAIEFINPVAASLTGWSEEEAVGKPLGAVLRLIDERSGAPVTPAQARPLSSSAEEIPLAIIRKDESLLSVDDSDSPIRDEAGARVGGVIVFRDATEQRRQANRRRLLAESTALHRSLDHRDTLEALAELAVPALGDVCLVRLLEAEDRGPALAFAHAQPEQAPSRGEVEAWLESAAQSPGEGADPLRLAVARGQALLWADVADAQMPLAAWVRRLKARSWISVPLISRGEVIGAFLIGRTDQRQRFDTADLAMVEELAGPAAAAVENALLYSQSRNAIRLRDEFLSIASHELRTPLSSLQLQLEMLRRVLRKAFSEDAQVTAKLSTSLRQTGRLARLIDGLLDVSRISSGRLELQLERFDLNDLINEVVERFHDDAARAGCELKVYASPGVVGVWDRLRLEQVFLNLLSNAAKYASDQPIEIRLERRDGNASLSVRDHGIGIAEQDLRRIFGLYERAVPIRHFGGLGLGLYIARQIVEAHGGRINVQAVPQQGSTFTIDLPLLARTQEGIPASATH